MECAIYEGEKGDILPDEEYSALTLDRVIGDVIEYKGERYLIVSFPYITILISANMVKIDMELDP